MKVSVYITKDIQRILSRKSKIYSIIMFSVGLLGIIIGAIFFNIFEARNIKYLVLFGFFMLLGILFFSMNIRNEKAVGSNPMKFDYEFFEDYFTFESSKDDKKISTEKFYYKNCFKMEDKSGFLFIYPANVVALPIKKSELAEEQVETIKTWFKNAKLANKNSTK